MLLICMLISSPVFATKPDAPNKSEMNIFELGIRPDRDNDFADVPIPPIEPQELEALKKEYEAKKKA